MGLSDPWADSIDMIALRPVKNDLELTQWDLVYLGTTLFILLPYRQLK